MEKKFIEAVEKALFAVGQKTLFGNPMDNLENACIEFLKYRGYNVSKPQKYLNTKVKSLKDLIDLFYSLLDKRLDDTSCYISYRNNQIKDLAIAKSFVDSRMVVNDVGRDIALKECANIVKTIFDHYYEFNFKYPINFSIFGQKKMGWVTDKALQILNRCLKDEIEDRSELKRKEALAAQDTSNLGYQDIDELLEKFEMEENNGKEEKG